jgi:hypothetical protein
MFDLVEGCLQPLAAERRNRRRLPIWQEVNDMTANQIDDDRAVGLPSQEDKIVNAQVPLPR